MKVSFIGFGNMAKAIAQGLLHHNDIELRAASPSSPIGIDENGIKTYRDNNAVLPDADVLILAVKPVHMADVLLSISTKIPPHCLLISVAAGLNLAWFAKHCKGAAIVRAMPNIAAAIGKSATPLIANECVTKAQKQRAEDIFTRIGLVSWTPNEADIDALTALSGSGPAYIFTFMEAMIQAAIRLGITEDIAESFALQTFVGAVSLVTESKLRIPQLRKKVISPAGSTAAALAVFTEHHFDELIFSAMKAASLRAKQLILEA